MNNELETLLQQAEEQAETYAVVNDELIIDGETREINVPQSEMLFGVEGDVNIERKYFRCPKIVGDNVDLSKHFIYVAYVYTESQDGSIFPTVGIQTYRCTDVQAEGDDITFSWKLSGNVFQNPGFIAFKVFAKEKEESPTTVFNTTPAFGIVKMTIPDGNKEIAEEYPDIINQLLTKMESVEQIATPEAMQGYVDAYLKENPVTGGITEEQKQQLEQNTQDITDLKSALPDKLDTNQGSDNAGKYLTVGDDGNITTSDALTDDGVSLPTGGTTGQVLTKRSNTDNDVVWRSGISGKNEDDNSDYNIVTKIKDGNLTAILEYTSHSPSPGPSPGGDELDAVAINGKTYREIFVDGNKIQWGDFESGIDGFTISSGTPELSEEECVSRTHSLKVFGEISQQYRINNAYSHTNSTSVYIALKAKCDRHIKGTLGFTNGAVTVGASDRTNGFETYSVIDTKPGIKSCFIGSISSANLDGYVDDIVVINITEIFGDSVPEKEMLDNAYNNYISIITSDSSSNMSYNLISGASAKRTEEYILSSDKHIEHTDSECIDAFMALVNKKAKYYGMLNSNFTSPSGAGGNTSCAKDLAIAGYYACGYRDVLDVWKHKQYEVKVYGSNSRDIRISSTVMNTPIGDYTVYGGKTGSWARTENLLVVAEANNEVFICVVMDCGSSKNRFVAMEELLDVISSSSGEVSTALAACAYKIPTQIPQLHNISEETAIYTKNDTQEIIPASVTKVMTAITALDYADSLSEKILFKPSDLESGSGAIFQAGDIITLNDALAAMLLPSSNMAAKAVARNIGKKYLERFGK